MSAKAEDVITAMGFATFGQQEFAERVGGQGLDITAVDRQGRPPDLHSRVTPDAAKAAFAAPNGLDPAYYPLAFPWQGRARDHDRMIFTGRSGTNSDETNGDGERLLQHLRRFPEITCMTCHCDPRHGNDAARRRNNA